MPKLSLCTMKAFPRTRYAHAYIFLCLIFLYYNLVTFDNFEYDESPQTRALSGLNPGSGIELPPRFSHLIDKNDFFKPDFDRSKITPFYWHIAKAAGTTVHDYYSQCYTLIEASEIGSFASRNTTDLKLVKKNGSTNHINVDVSTPSGIIRAKEKGLIPSHLAQIVVSPLVTDATRVLFTEEHQGLLFAMFRHPIERIVSLFYYLQSATWEPTYNPELANMTIDEYANSPLLEANFMTRSLVDKMVGPLSMDDIEMAKEIIRRKVFVGLVGQFETSVRNFNEVCGFEPNFDVEIDGIESKNITDDIESNEIPGKREREQRKKDCIHRLTGRGGSNRHRHQPLQEGSETYQILERKNAWDMTLWDFIEEEFGRQQTRLYEKQIGLDWRFILNEGFFYLGTDA